MSDWISKPVKFALNVALIWLLLCIGLGFGWMVAQAFGKSDVLGQISLFGPKSAYAATARPAGHYEPVNPATTSPGQAYDADSGTSADTNLQTVNGGDAIYYGQDSANNNSWEGGGSAQAGCTLYVRYGATDAGDDIGEINIDNSAKTQLYQVVSYDSTASIAATWWSQTLTSGECADYADLRVTVYTDKVGGGDNTSYLHIWDIYLDYTVPAPAGRRRMIFQ